MVIAGPELVIGSSPAVRGVLPRLERWASLRFPILFRGERGTGKSTLARYVHGLSGRAGALVTAAMNHMSEGLEVAELTGSLKGSYTGAVADRVSPFVRAHRGTIFLEELAWATERSQSALLTILDTGRFTPVGGQHEVVVDVRVVAATNADLESLVARGLFLRDLLDRFGYYVVTVPPLRQRRDEIIPLMRRHLEVEACRSGRRPPAVSEALRRVLERAPWPGNIRQAVAVAQWLVGNAGDVAGAEDLPDAFRAEIGLRSSPKEPLTQRLPRILTECGGNKSEAARRLGVTRQHVHRVLELLSQTPNESTLPVEQGSPDRGRKGKRK